MKDYNNDQKNLEEYQRLFAEHENLTRQILQLNKKVGVIGPDKEISAEIIILDKEQYELHRKMEEIGKLIGKSSHEINQDILAYRFSVGKETKIPGLIVVPYPYPFSEGLSFDPQGIKDNIVKAGEWSFDLSRSEQFPDIEKYLESQNFTQGFIIIYDMENRYGGEDVKTSGKCYDGARDIKEGRIIELQKYLEAESPSGKFIRTEWVSEEGGVYHQFDRSSFKGLLVDTEHLEHAMAAIREHRGTFWLTDEEYKEMGSRVVREKEVRVSYKKLEEYVDPSIRVLARELYKQWRSGLKDINEDLASEMDIEFCEYSRTAESADGKILEQEKRLEDVFSHEVVDEELILRKIEKLRELQEGGMEEDEEEQWFEPKRKRGR